LRCKADVNNYLQQKNSSVSVITVSYMLLIGYIFAFIAFLLPASDLGLAGAIKTTSGRLAEGSGELLRTESRVCSWMLTWPGQGGTGGAGCFEL